MNSFGLAARRIYRWMALLGVFVGLTVQSVFAQEGASVPVIRVETRQVLIPMHVWLRRPRGYYGSRHLTANDLHLFEDGKEQTITRATLVRFYGAVDLVDNIGGQWTEALTPKGKWVNLRDQPVDGELLPTPIYIIAYRPPQSPEGSCHKIKITVNPKDESGNTMTTGEFGPTYDWNPHTRSRELGTEKVQGDRRDLVLEYRKQYCNVVHSAIDPLYGTPESKRLEDMAMSQSAVKAHFDANAVDLFEESNISHTHIAFDFSHLSSPAGDLSFPVSLLGVISRSDGTPALRFTDSAETGCAFDEVSDPGSVFICGRRGFINHYETEADLPPGKYILRAALDFGGTLRRAELPVSVRPPETSLAVSGIALCKRYYPHDPPLLGPPPNTDGIPTLPFELKPLVSKGVEFTPTAETRFKKKDPLAAYFEIYEPLLSGGGNARVQFELRIVDAKTGEVKSDTGYKPADEYETPGKAVIPIAQKIAIDKLAPGDYQIEVRATDSTGTVTGWQAASFTKD